MTVRPPLNVAAYIAPGADLSGPPDNYQWVQVGGDDLRRLRTRLEVDYGRDDEAAEVEPATGNITFDDRDGNLSPRNPLGQWYGDLVDGTPARFMLLGYAYDDFDRTVASSLGTSSSGNTWTAPGWWSVSGGAGHITHDANQADWAWLANADTLNFRVRAALSIDDTPTANSFVFAVTIRAVDEDDGYYCYFEFRSTGVMSVKLVRRDAGVNTSLEETITSVPYTPGTPVEICVEVEGNRARGKVWESGDPEPNGWHVSELIGRIDGARTGFFTWRLSGSGTDPITVSVTDYRLDAILFSGDLAELPVVWDKSGRDSTVPAGLAGPLRRLTTGEDETSSPLARQLPGYAPAAYWPLETSDSAATPLTRRATCTRCSFGDSDAPAGASAAAKFDTDISYAFFPVDEDTGDEWAGLIMLKLNALPSAEIPTVEWRSPTGTVGRWALYISSTTFTLRGYNSAGTEVVTAGPYSQEIDPTEWWSVQLETVQDGGSVDWALLWVQVGVDVSWAATGTIAGTTRRLTSMYINAHTDLTDLRFCHAWAGPETLPYISAAFRAVAAGYAGETAAARLERLFGEAGLTISIPPRPTGGDTLMGPQRAGKFLDLVRECIAADAGVFMEDGYGFRYESRTARYNVEPRMVIEWSGDDGMWTGGQLWEAPDPVDDDQRRRNRFTVKRVDGGEATVEDPDDIVRRGLRKGTPGSDLNLYSDDQLAEQASWRLWLAKWDEPRWPRIVLNLVANPELIPSWMSCRIGSRIRIVGPKSQMAGQWIDLIIEGASQRVGQHEWLVTLSCSPALLGDVALYDDDSKRKDSPSTVLAAAVDADDTVWRIETDDLDDCWSQTSTPYPWSANGEEVSVLSMSAPGSVASADGGFETDDGGWQVTGGTIARSTAQAHTGDASLLLTVSGSPVQAYTRPTSAAEVVVGESYTASMWVRCSVSRNVFCAIDWYDAGFNYLTTSGTTVAVTADTWTLISTTQTAPANAAFAGYGPTMSGSPANGTLLYVDDADLVDDAVAAGAGPYPQTAIVARGQNGVTRPHSVGATVRMARRMLARYAL